MRGKLAFTDRELATLREHGVAIFADRVIFDAQPPMSDAAIEQIAAQCAGPLPEALVALWRTTAGGSLDYDLSVRFGDDHVEALSWTELYYHRSDGVLDLQGWIDHELEQTPGKKLLALPIGGFEHVERIYVFVGPGASRGAVFAWSEGPPPAWTKPTHGESVARIADDLRGAFAALTLTEKPGADSVFLEHVEGLVEAGLGRELGKKLVAFYQGAVSDLKALRKSGDPKLALRALTAAIKRDDAASIRQLARQVPLDRPIAGPAIPLEFAVSVGFFAAADALLEAGAPINAAGLTYLHEAASPKLVQALLDRGAEPLIQTIVNCARGGNRATADLVSRAYAARHKDLVPLFRKAHAAELAQQRENLKMSKKGTFSHYAGEGAIERNIRNLETYKLPSK
ncbi:MAG: SMI1/KNR4 family protein [Deltaproteobacteria bacterium]|nr:SMI1/KNR4 family protein [Kofleriaceae bacterium]